MLKKSGYDRKHNNETEISQKLKLFNLNQNWTYNSQKYADHEYNVFL